MGDVYAPTSSIPHWISPVRPDVHAVQSTVNWALPTILSPDPILSSPSPSFTQTTPSPIPQSVVLYGLPVSTNQPDYMWVPQRQYALTAHQFNPVQPILFNVDSGEPGIRLSTALNRKFSHLRDRDDLVFESSKSPTITMRLEVCPSFQLAWALPDGA